MSWFSNLFSADQPAEKPQAQPGVESAPDPGEEARYSVEHSGWSAVGWEEEDPTPEEAMSALASMSRADYSVTVDGLRKAAEEQLEALQAKGDRGRH